MKYSGLLNRLLVGLFLGVILIIIVTGLVWRHDNSTNTAPASVTAGTYAALGDSVAAGYGLPSLANSSPEDALCGRAAQAYPVLAAQALHMRLRNAACSGATATDLIHPQNVRGNAIPSQLDAAFKTGTPQLISITIGANDTGWANVIQTCYTGTCDTPANTLAADAALVPMQAHLALALTSINDRSHRRPPPVVVTGYYHIVASSCPVLQPNVTPSEISWFRNETDKLNKALQTTAAGYSFARYAPISFVGHDLCSQSSWIQGITDPGPLQPTAEGQAAIAQAVTNAATGR